MLKIGHENNLQEMRTSRSEGNLSVPGAFIIEFTIENSVFFLDLFPSDLYRRCYFQRAQQFAFGSDFLEV